MAVITVQPAEFDIAVASPPIPDPMPRGGRDDYLARRRTYPPRLDGRLVASFPNTPDQNLQLAAFL